MARQKMKYIQLSAFVVYSGRVRHTARSFETPFPEFEVIPSGTF